MLTHSLKAPAFKPSPLNINPGFKNVPFKFNPRHYSPAQLGDLSVCNPIDFKEPPVMLLWARFTKQY